MKALIQRVSEASVTVERECVGAIENGLLILLAVEKGDSEVNVKELTDKLVNYRVFSDDAGKMNLSLKQIDGQALVVSQFTLAASTSKGLRPSFSSAAAPDIANKLYQNFVECLRSELKKVATGKFAADMQVQLTNDGPVTFMLESKPV